MMDTFRDEILAEEAVKRVQGVRAVVDNLQVDLPVMHVRDDADIARAASSALYWDTLLPESIKIVVKDGFVALSGQVQWNYQREEAEDVVRRIGGVRVVNGSKVIITGKVHSWYERNEASRAAWSIHGVTSVDNEIAIV